MNKPRFNIPWVGHDPKRVGEPAFHRIWRLEIGRLITDERMGPWGVPGGGRGGRAAFRECDWSAAGWGSAAGGACPCARPCGGSAGATGKTCARPSAPSWCPCVRRCPAKVQSNPINHNSHHSPFYPSIVQALICPPSLDSRIGRQVALVLRSLSATTNSTINLANVVVGSRANKNNNSNNNNTFWLRLTTPT